VGSVTETIRPIPHPVALITDVARVGRLPNGNVLMHLRRTDTLMPDNVDIALLINAPYAFVNFMSIIIRVRPRVRQLTRFTYSLDEAQAMVAEQRQHTSTLGNSDHSPR
jgi:hypothetical protein